MICTCYRIDAPTLVAALTQVDMLVRYEGAIGDEIPSLADRSLVRHLRRMSTLASRAMASGFDRLASDDEAAADELLSDVFAVATYRGWPLPIADLGEREVDVAGMPRGLLGADVSSESASVWLIDPATIALARTREAGDVADLAHPRLPG
ncbi:MAG: hypothetical protein H0V44_04015 [Planctomycetes bacterium]|nr:hypothetical protein [Planctomycetota bacterium]